LLVKATSRLLCLGVYALKLVFIAEKPYLKIEGLKN
jgi:hypothetical protein